MKENLLEQLADWCETPCTTTAMPLTHTCNWKKQADVKFKYLWVGRSRFEKHLKPAFDREPDLRVCDLPSDVIDPDFAMEDEQTRADGHSDRTWGARPSGMDSPRTTIC